MLSRLGKERGYKIYPEQWIHFFDSRGWGYAQPDIFMVGKTRVILIECKLTQNDGAEQQCLGLYKPLLENLFELPVVSCQIFKNIRYETKNMVESLEQLEQSTGYTLWHNLGE